MSRRTKISSTVKLPWTANRVTSINPAQIITVEIADNSPKDLVIIKFINGTFQEYINTGTSYIPVCDTSINQRLSKPRNCNKGQKKVTCALRQGDHQNKWKQSLPQGPCNHCDWITNNRKPTAKE